MKSEHSLSNCDIFLKAHSGNSKYFKLYIFVDYQLDIKHSLMANWHEEVFDMVKQNQMNWPIIT